MGKKKFGGEKVDVKGVLHEPPASKQPSGPAWSKGAGAAAVAPPASSSAPVGPPKVAAKPVAGSWAKGGPQGLAATATSLNAQAKFAPAARPKPAAFGAAGSAKLALGLKRDLGPPPPSLDCDAFAPLERPKDAKELAREKAQAVLASAFPEVSTCEEAMTALCNAAQCASSGPLQGRLDAAFGWLLRSGLPEAPSPEARDRILCAGGLIVAELTPQKEGCAAQITGILEGYFAEQQSKGKNTPQVLEANGLVDAVLFGKLALHLEDGNHKIPSIRMRLLRRLIKPTTPQLVQRALADALVPLLTKEEKAQGEGTGAKSPAMASSDMCFDLFGDASEAVRKGAALGLAAAARACGAGTLRKKIMEDVEAAIKAEGKTSAGRRQAGLFCFAELAAGLGRAFEPQALKCLPLLLSSCADDKKEVYTAGRAAAQEVVANVSVNCLKMMVKPVVEGIRDKRWRAQISSIELLKTIVVELAENAPKRMAMVLPQVVPPLCEAAASARGEVRDVVRAVLEKIGANISHRDVAALAPQLIAALAEPTEGPIAKALDSLLGAVYTTAIDGAACALICPVIERALIRGDADAQQKGATFARGLVLHVGESEELTPYFVTLRAPLQALLSHPNPGVREAAAQAIGALAAAPTQDESIDSSSKLLAKLDQQHDGAELEGTAQGISATLASVSDERRQELLSELLRQDVGKEGRLSRLCVCAQLPKSMAGVADGGSTVAAVLPVLMTALSDSDEAVRAMARRGFSTAAEVAREPSAAAVVARNLELALREEDPRARVAAAELAFGFMPNRALIAERNARAALVAAAVIAQADPDPNVRRTADRVWRAATEAGGAPGKQLKELRPHLLTRIVQSFEGGEVLPAKAAGRAAAQLHDRLESSGGLLDSLAPGIREALLSPERAVQKSACVGLAEVLRVDKCSKYLLGNDELSSGLRSVLFSDTPEVRVAAATCACAAPVAFVVEPLASELCQASMDLTPEQILALEELVRADGSGAALKVVIAKASSNPPSGSKVSCLAAAAAAPPVALRHVIDQVTDACVEACASDFDAASTVAKAWACRLDADGIQDFMAASLSKIDRGCGDRHSEAAACVIGEILGASSVQPASSEELLDVLLPGALLVADGRCAATFARTLQALVQIAGASVLAEEAAPRISAILSQGIRGDVVATDTFEALVPILQQGVIGAVAQRKASVDSLALLCKRVDVLKLQGHAVKCAGPLVRALAEKSAEQGFQEAVLLALGVLLERAGDVLRPLVPALLTALVKALDGPSEVQVAAARALAALAAAAPKVEVVAKALGKPPLKAAHMEALATVLRALSATRLAEAGPAVQAILEVAGKAGDEAVTGFAAEVAAALRG